MTTSEVPSFCRICEAFCGVLVELDGDTIVNIRGDDQHPVSQGYICPKASAMARVVTDPDRVTEALRRDRRTGEFLPVGWDDALDDIAARLNRLRKEEGPDSIAMYFGNPISFSASHLFWFKGFIDAIGTRNLFAANSQDIFGRLGASLRVFGSTLVYTIPDIPRSDFVLLLGANPLTSHGSLVSLPRIADRLRDVEKRGGRVVVVDPSRTRTAKAFEHVGIRPRTDLWLLASMLHVLFFDPDSPADPSDATRVAVGVEKLREAVEPYTPATAADVTGIEASTIRQLAIDYCSADAAVAYSRVGLDRSEFGTTCNALVDALNIVSGNFDRAGGAMFGKGLVDFVELGRRMGLSGAGKTRSRVHGLPELGGVLPMVLADEIEAPGRGQVRALITSAGNPVMTTADSERLRAALKTLDLFVSVDLYVTDTNASADYILPVPASLEREDLPVILGANMPIPFSQWTEPVVDAPPGVRAEWEIFDELAVRMGMGGPFAQKPVRVLAKMLGRFGQKITPNFMVDMLIRSGRSGWSLKKLRTHPRGVKLDPIAEGVASTRIAFDDGLARLADPDIIEQLGTAAPPDPSALYLVGRRVTRQMNSWLHNVSRPHEPTLWMHPADADAAGVADGQYVTLQSGDKSGECLVEVTEDVTPGTVSYPNGYGHKSAGANAQEHGGLNINSIIAGAATSRDPISGSSILEGIPVEVVPAQVVPG